MELFNLGNKFNIWILLIKSYHISDVNGIFYIPVCQYNSYNINIRVILNTTLEYANFTHSLFKK